MDASFTFLHRTLVMTSAATRRWRPRSLLQLVLLAFVVVMLPLGVLMYQAGQALSELSRLAEVSARQAVSETRRARTLGSLAVEMERGARQYAVIQEESLLDIYADRLAEFRELLARQRLLHDKTDRFVILGNKDVRRLIAHAGCPSPAGGKFNLKTVRPGIESTSTRPP